MKTQTPEAVAAVARALDLGALVVAFLLAAWLAAGDADNMPFGEVLALRVKLLNLLLFVGLVGVWTLVLTSFGLYHSYIYRTKAREIRDLVAAVASCAGVVWISHGLFRIELIGPEFIIFFGVVALLLSIAGRLSIRLALRQMRRKGRNVRHLLIVGTNARAVQLARRIESLPELGYSLVGFVDDQWTGSAGFQHSGYCVVADFAGFSDFIASNVVDEVMVCVPIKSFYERCSQVVAQCEEQGVTARFVSDMFTPTVGRTYVERFDNHAVLTIDTGGMRGSAMAVKRAVDVVVSSAALLLLSPLLVTIAIMIKLRSPGPVLFAQERMGLNKRRFKLYKFRTMVPDAERKIAELEHLNEVSGPVFKIRNDPRITPIGRFLRKTSLDEMPQLVNVLKGDMSLVGPRPLPVRDYQSFSTAWHRRRFSVKPGITCLWQVMGRNSIPFERWMELDMEYIDRWSLLLDLQILIKTIPAVVKGSGAS